MMLTVVVTIDPEGQVPNQLLGAAQYFGTVIEVQFAFEGGEEALHHLVFPATAGKLRAALILLISVD